MRFASSRLPLAILVRRETVAADIEGLALAAGTSQCRIGGKLIGEGNFLSLDGNTGAVHFGC